MATLFDSASLAMIPSGYKDDKLYSIKPTDGSGDFTFSRDGAGASPATRVNASGLIEKGRTNELLQSNTFSNASWTNDDSTETGGQADKDGGTSAWLLVGNTNASRHHLRQSFSISGVTTFSIYVKASGHNTVQLASASSGQQYANFDLSDGSIGDVGSSFIDAKAISIGNGWYRLSIVNPINIMVGCYISLVSSKTAAWLESWSMSNATDGILIQDAQLEQGLISTSYIETTTAPVSAGLLGDMPRLDYSGGATCPSLLLEPSRVNLVPYSEYLGASDWVKLGAGTGSAPVITENYATSPEGVQNATRVQLNLNGGTSSGGQSLFYDDLGSKTGTFTRSVYIKSLTTDTDLYFGGTLTDNKVITATTEWQRFDFTSTLSASSLFVTIGLRGTTGSDDSADILVYGIQAEEGSYPTSYIPTYGAASARGADICSKTGISSLIGQTSGVFFAECVVPDYGSNNNATLFYTESSVVNSISCIYKNTGIINFRIFQNSVAVNADSASTYTIGEPIKVACKWEPSGMKLFVNGVLESTVTTSIAFTSTLQEIDIFNASEAYYGNPTTNKAKQFLSFTTALTDAECIALTTI